MALPALAIATGDPAGIGPEISLKAALDPAVRALFRPVLYGDRKVLERHARGLALDEASLVEVPFEGELRLGEISPEHGRAALACAQAAIRGALAGEHAAVLAAPHVEASIHAAGIAFDGYPSLLARLCGLPPEAAVLMLCFAHERREVRIAHVTLHAGVAQALSQITRKRVLHVLECVARALEERGIERPKIALGGVNPHAGEGGAFGREEIDVIAPAIEQARREAMAVDGPFGADTLIQRAGYDAYVVMLHDQGHVAAKLLAPQRVAAVTLGTPVLFASVGHGAALDIAGTGRASHVAMVEAITRLKARRRRAPAT